MSWIDQHPDMAGAFDAVSTAKSVDPKLFREAMSRLGAAVHVITTDGPAGKTGFTATAVCSVSDAPSTLLVCLNRGSSSSPILRGNGVFCVNTLRAGEEIIADTFADEGANVAVCARTQGNVDTTVAALKAMGVQSTGAAVDVSDKAAYKGWIDSAAATTSTSLRQSCRFASR